MSDMKNDADKIVDSILDHKRPDVDEGLYIDDLIWHAHEFSIERQIMSDFSSFFPCIQRSDGATVPLALSQMGHYKLGPPFYGFQWRRLDDAMLNDESLVRASFDEAEEYFRTGMIKSLASRIRSLRADFDESTTRLSLSLPVSNFLGFSTAFIATSGFNVEVSASPNLRVHVSPTFRRSWRFFASPTSPASGTLPGGIYEFGVDGGPYAAITPDIGTFDIPYTTVKPALSL